MPESDRIQNPSQTLGRLPAIDAMRGIVMVLMTLDHASHAFNSGRYVTDTYAWYTPGAEIPAVQFLVRWVTHLCAPTFVFLAGFVLALSVARRQAREDTPGAIDSDIFKRGILILLLDPLWMSIGFGRMIVFQVLYAIGAGFCCMVLLRRVGIIKLLVIGLGILLFSEVLAGLAVWVGGGQSPEPIGAFLFTGKRIADNVAVVYPLIPWLAYMILGWVFGGLMLKRTSFNPVRVFAMAGAVSMVGFFIVRGFNGYGNMLLYRYDHSVVQWLHVSKYPPSLSFSTLELGIMFLMLSLLFKWYRGRNASSVNPLNVFGRTPLFFYVIHVHLLAGAAWLLNMRRTGGLVETFIATAAALIVLYPLCRFYGRLKQTYPKSLLRYV